MTLERQQIWDRHTHGSVSIECSSFPSSLLSPLGTRSDPILHDWRAEIAQPACDLSVSHKRAFPALTAPTLETS